MSTHQLLLKSTRLVTSLARITPIIVEGKPFLFERQSGLLGMSHQSHKQGNLRSATRGGRASGSVQVGKSNVRMILLGASAIGLFRGEILKRTEDLLWATLGEGGLVLALAAIGWATRQPLIFASLGPTAYELVEQPHVRSARVYNIIVGHLVGLGAGFLALYLLNAWAEPNVISSGIVSTKRLWAGALAASVTTFVTLILKAGQPAALATTLLISLGSMQTRRDAIAIIVGVLIMTAIGEPVRRFGLKRAEIPQVVSGT